jgi:hypothetical protein
MMAVILLSHKGDFMGAIIDQNSNTSSVDTWALITGTTVVNTILCNLAGAESIQASYDYLVDLTVQGQTAGIGWTYAPSTDTFSSPPPTPTDWELIVEEDFDQIVTDLLQLLSDASNNLTPTQLAVAYSYATADSSGSYTTNQAALMDKIYQYILNGG